MNIANSQLLAIHCDLTTSPADGSVSLETPGSQTGEGQVLLIR